MSLRTEVTDGAVDLAGDLWQILDNGVSDVVYSDPGSNKVFLDDITGRLFEITVKEVIDDGDDE